MRKWILIGFFGAAAVLGAGVYWHFTKTPNVIRNSNTDEPIVRNSNNKNEGDAEPSDVIEPMIVFRRNMPPAEEVRGEFGNELAILPRVLQPVGVEQPPRPDAEREVRRMPYADEAKPVTEALWMFPNLCEIADNLAKLNLFKDIDKTDPSEESEPREPMPRPQIEPNHEFHHQEVHCPYQGPCPVRR